MNNITVIILAGGRATRMGSLCTNKPKCLIEFNELPFIIYLVRWLVSYNLNVILSIGYNSEPITKIFNVPYWKSRKVCLVNEDEPLGTGGAIKLSINHVHTKYFMICNGDTILDIDLMDLFIFHQLNECIATCVVTEKDDVPNYNSIAIRNGMVIDFNENIKNNNRKNYIYPDIHMASSTGYYLFNRDDEISGYFFMEKCSFENDIIPRIVNDGILSVYNNKRNYFYDYGTIERFEKLILSNINLNEIYK